MLIGRYGVLMSLDTLSRRLRTAGRQPRVSRLSLAEADYRLFEAIERHGPLPSHYLYEFTRSLRRDRSHLQNRLTEFYHGDQRGPLLTRPQQQFASFQARYQHLVYDLTARTRAALAERGCHRPQVRTDPFVHRLMTACITASFELSAETVGLRYIALNEILAHPSCGKARLSKTPLAIPYGRGSLVPDAIFGLEYPRRGFRFFALEADRNTESIERANLTQRAFARKAEAYAVIFATQAYRAWWGLPNLHILTVTTSMVHARNIRAAVAERAGPYATQYAFASEPTFGANWRIPSATLSALVMRSWSRAAGGSVSWFGQ